MHSVASLLPAAVFSVVTQRSSPRDENGCEADYGIDLLQVDLFLGERQSRERSSSRAIWNPKKDFFRSLTMAWQASKKMEQRKT